MVINGDHWETALLGKTLLKSISSHYKESTLFKIIKWIGKQ